MTAPNVDYTNTVYMYICLCMRDLGSLVHGMVVLWYCHKASPNFPWSGRKVW